MYIFTNKFILFTKFLLGFIFHGKKHCNFRAELLFLNVMNVLLYFFRML